MNPYLGSEPIPWGTDGPISLPLPKEDEGENAWETDVGGGFVFTVNGLRHDLTEVDREGIYRAPYSPGNYRG